MTTILGLGTALTLAFAPMAVEAKPKFKVRGNAAVAQLLNGAVAANAKQVRKVEKELRKAARKAGVPLGVATTVAVAAGGGAAAAQAARPAPVRFAPEQVNLRPRLRPENIGYASLDEAPATPPVTTIQDGARVVTSSLAAEAATALASRRVTSTNSVEIADTTVTTTGPKTVQVETDRVSTDPVLAEADRIETSSEVQPVSLEADASNGSTLFGGPTGY